MQNFMITLLICSVAMSVLALLYMAAMPLLAKRYSEKGRYYAWLIIVVGLIIPFRPQWGAALFSVEVPSSTPPPVVQVSGEITPFFPPIALPTLPSLPPVENAVTYGATINISWWHIAVAVWLAGAIIFIAFHGIKHYRFMKVAQRWSKNITDEKTLFLIETLKSEMGITQRIPVYVCPFAGSPMMIGLIKPQMLLPTVELAQDELCFIIKHELVHYRRKDLLYKCLVLAARALHWFNPIVHLIARAVNILCEMSCDAEVLRSADTDTRLSYGETIIGVVQNQSKLCTALSTTFYGGRKSMKTRISSIMDTRKKRAGAIITAVILTLTMVTGVVFAATATNNEYAQLPSPGTDDSPTNGSAQVPVDRFERYIFTPGDIGILAGKSYHNLTQQGDLQVTATDIFSFQLFTNSSEITVAIPRGGYEGTFYLYDVENTDTPIQQFTLDNNNRTRTFSNLTSAKNYFIVATEINATVTITLSD